jgi:hypothetical protein
MSKHKKAASAAKIHKDSMECNKPRKTPGHATKSHVVKALVKTQQQPRTKHGRSLITHGIMPRILTLIRCQQGTGRIR